MSETVKLKIQLGRKCVVFHKLGKHLLCDYSVNTAFEQGKSYGVFNVLQWIRLNKRANRRC